MRITNDNLQVQIFRPEEPISVNPSIKKVVDDNWSRRNTAPVEKDLYDLDLSIREVKILDSPQRLDSHGCTVNATCEGCRGTDNCNHTHYCATNNRCGHTDAC